MTKYCTIKLPCLSVSFLPLFRGLLSPRGTLWCCAGESQFLLFKTETLPRWPGQLQWLWQLQPTKPREKPWKAGEAFSKPRRGSCRRGGSYIVNIFLSFVLWHVGCDSLYGEWRSIVMQIMIILPYPWYVNSKAKHMCGFISVYHVMHLLN